MKKLIICLVALTALLTVLSARNLPVPENTGNLTPSIREKSNVPSAEASYGKQYFRSNSRHRFQAAPQALINLDNLSADVKVIPWDKDYAEIEIMKISGTSREELDNCEVWLDNAKNITLGTTFSDPLSDVLVNITLKVPRSIELGAINNHRGELNIKNIDPVRFSSR
ncbi:MAG: hypothetical protein K9N06_07115 [Candidatus Cloacimonetes bacterium]|nr:hypothetical protein [Candidatus Cloacimonadota bacterium]